MVLNTDNEQTNEQNARVRLFHFDSIFAMQLWAAVSLLYSLLGFKKKYLTNAT